MMARVLVPWWQSDESIQKIIGELVDKDVATEVSVAVGLRRQRCKVRRVGYAWDDEGQWCRGGTV